MNYKSQIGQDKWVQSVLGDKPNGYFIELGACDGVYYSNSYFFEKSLGWSGICIEPNDNFLTALRANRSCHVDNGLAFSIEGEEVEFSQCDALGGIIDENIGPFTERKNTVKKITTTLGNILDKYQAPSIIDYLSLDVEGQEYNILRTFPFDKYKFRCITVEHNAPHIGTEHQMNIRTCLEANGYKFVKGNDDVQGWNHGPIDDYYVHPELV